MDLDLTQLKPGDRVAFSDSQATTSTGEEGVAEGTVNGEPIADDAGAITHVPIWAERDNGREATTIFVGAANILGKR
jgi:hypothetical protein